MLVYVKNVEEQYSYLDAKRYRRRNTSFNGRAVMRVNIIKIDYTEIHKEISRQTSPSNMPQYCIMNQDTLKLLKKESDHMYFLNDDTCNRICGLKIAICPEIRFGEVDII